MKHLTLIVMLIGLFIITACSPEPAQNQPTLVPTIPVEPSPTPEYNNLNDASEVALRYLEHWVAGDYEGLYDLIAPASQQAFSYSNFLATYENSNREMRLNTMSYVTKSLTRLNNRIVALTYDMTFESGLIGEFSDIDRKLELVLDHDLQAWRVAWTPGNIFAEMEDGIRLRMETVQPQRAAIYDRNGTILADMNGRIVNVFVTQTEIPDRAVCLETLSRAFNLPITDIEARLSRNNENWLADLGWIEAGTFSQNQSALETDCKAQFEGRPTRRYIYGDLYAHIIGNVGYPDPAQVPEYEAVGFRQDSIVGVSGIERSWDSYLRGRAGGRLTLVTITGELVRVLGEKGTEPAHSVYLTIDTDLQRFAIDRITQSFAMYAEAWGSTSKGGAVIVLDVNTGEILAMASYPTFDSNAFTPFPVMGLQQGQTIVRQVESDWREPQLNRVTQGVYPGGSTIKTFSAIAALDSGVYDFTTTYSSTGTWNRDIIRVDWLGGGHGRLNLAQALTHSCNTCFYEVGYQLDNIDPYIMSSYFNKMGLGVQPLFSDLPTSSGFIGTPDTKATHHPEPWSFSDNVNIAIGQGMVEVSPLQMAVGYMMVANEGRLYRPQLVSSARLLNIPSYQMQPDLARILDIDPTIYPYLHEGLCDVVVKDWGTASHIFMWSPQLLEDYGACGKTGTAENPPRRLPHAWFAGWTPAQNPEIIVVAIVENAGDGSDFAAPIVRDVMEFYHYGEDLEDVWGW
jgi:cell division protein FtsI/penicillin-binding protein 2